MLCPFLGGSTIRGFTVLQAPTLMGNGILALILCVIDELHALPVLSVSYNLPLLKNRFF